MLVTIAIFVGLVLGSCSGAELKEQVLPLEIDVLEKTDSSTSNKPNVQGAHTVVGFSASGEKAVYKEFIAQRTNADKALHFVLKGFLGETEIIRPTSGSNVEMKWTFLAESQDVIDKYADTTIPDIDKSNADYDSITFGQLENCRGFSKIRLNESTHYSVQGVCISHPSISISSKFGNKVFLNSKLIHDPNYQ
jgi:hypothetical protein